MPKRKTRTKKISRNLRVGKKLLKCLSKVQQRKKLTKGEKTLLLRAYRAGKFKRLRGSGLFDSIGNVLGKLLGGVTTMLNHVA